MRDTKLALTFGLMALAMYGCGDSGGSGTKKDGGPDGPATTKNDAAPKTDANVDVPATTPDTAPPTPVDGGAKLDGPVVSPSYDAGQGIDGPATVPPVDGGARIDGATAVDAGAGIDGGKAIDGGAAADAPAGRDSPASARTCNYPACFDSLAKNCEPRGACVMQTIAPTIGAGSMTSSTTSCYANGVKMQVASTYSVDLGSGGVAGTTVTSVKNDAGLCYTTETPYSLATLTTVTSTIKSPSGATVGTITVNSTANTQTITCTGQAPVVLSLDCDSSGADAGSGTACTTGTCAF